MGLAVRRYWFLILGAIFVFAVAGSIAAGAQPVTYTSSAKVLLRPIIGNTLGPDNGTSGQQVTIAMQTEATLVDSDPVAVISNKTLTKKWVPGSGTVTAVVPPNTQILLISFKAKSAKDAQAGAQAVAKGFLSYRQAQALADQESRTDFLTKQINASSKKLVTATESQQSDDVTEAANASRQVQLLTDQLVSLQDALSTLQAIETGPGSLLSPAQLPKGAGGLDTKILVAAGAILGLALGLVVGIALARGDKRVRRTWDSVSGVPVLAVLGPKKSWPKRMLPSSDPQIRQAYQRLRTGVLAGATTSSSIAFTDVRQSGLVGDVVSELADSFIRAGYRITVVIAGTDPLAEHKFGVAGEPGLSDALQKNITVDELLVPRNGVRVLPPGLNLDEFSERLSGGRFSEILQQLAADTDYLLVVAPAAHLPAAVAVGRVSSAMVLVGQELKTTTGDVADVVQRAHLVGARIIGLALRPQGLPAPGEHVSSTRQLIPWNRSNVGVDQIPQSPFDSVELSQPPTKSSTHNVP